MVTTVYPLKDYEYKKSGEPVKAFQLETHFLERAPCSHFHRLMNGSQCDASRDLAQAFGDTYLLFKEVMRVTGLTITTVIRHEVRGVFKEQGNQRGTLGRRQKGVTGMDLNVYCDGVGAELMGWKAKIGRVVNELDHVSTGDKSGVVAQVNELHMIMEELDDRIQRLNTQCPTQWEADKIELEGKFSGMIPNTQDLWQNVSPADFGG